MTVTETDYRSSSPLAYCQLILATDLDGPLATGTAAARRRTRDLFNGAVSGARLAFATGRSLESIIALLNELTIPRADDIRVDGGATILHCESGHVEPTQHGITIRWPGSQALKNNETHRFEARRMVGRVNGHFSTLDRVSVCYFHRSLSFEVIAHRAACAIVAFTPMRDGLHFLAQEFVAARKALARAFIRSAVFATLAKETAWKH